MRPGERDGDGELPDDAGESAAVVTGWPLGVNIGERVSEARASAFRRRPSFRFRREVVGGAPTLRRARAAHALRTREFDAQR